MEKGEEFNAEQAYQQLCEKLIKKSLGQFGDDDLMKEIVRGAMLKRKRTCENCGEIHEEDEEKLDEELDIEDNAEKQIFEQLQASDTNRVLKITKRDEDGNPCSWELSDKAKKCLSDGSCMGFNQRGLFDGKTLGTPCSQPIAWNAKVFKRYKSDSSPLFEFDIVCCEKHRLKCQDQCDTWEKLDGEDEKKPKERGDEKEFDIVCCEKHRLESPTYWHERVLKPWKFTEPWKLTPDAEKCLKKGVCMGFNQIDWKPFNFRFDRENEEPCQEPIAWKGTYNRATYEVGNWKFCRAHQTDEEPSKKKQKKR